MRKIRPEMVTFIDEALKKNGLAQLHIRNKNPRGLMVEAAKACVGQKELTGANDGFFVELAQKTVDGISQGEAWCMAFVQTMIAYAEAKTGVMSPLKSTEGCTDLWGSTKDEQKVKSNPLAGAIIIWQHGTSWKGHTGMVLDADEKSFNAVEGNASGYLVPYSEVTSKVNRDGNGVFYTHRSRIKAEGDMNLLGFIKPF